MQTRGETRRGGYSGGAPLTCGGYILVHELAQMGRPEFGVEGGVVTERPLARVHQKLPGTRNHGDCGFDDAKFRGEQLVVPNVDRKEPRPDPVEIAGRVVVHRGVDLVEAVIGVSPARPFDKRLVVAVGGFARRRDLLEPHDALRHQGTERCRADIARRVGHVVSAVPDGLDRYTALDPVAAAHGAGLACDGDWHLGEIRKSNPGHPG